MTTKRPQWLSHTELPNDLTNQFISRIEGLRGSVKTDYLKSLYLTKYVSSETAPALTRRNAAIRKWLAAEADNEGTNVRLLLTHAEYNILPRVSYERFTVWCRDFIRNIIGDTPPIDALIGSFSGGASTSRGRTESSPSSKYLGQAHVTPSALSIFSTIVDEMPGWIGLADLEVIPVSGNVLFTVPKKTDIDRVACKEPDLNMFIQKGIGTYFRRCLRQSGINLNDQSINSSLARIGSVTGDLVTLDLSSASDSVTVGLVAHLLPETWYTLLDAVRCQVTIIDGDEHRNQMFSSMGNGFTFELESLLFYAITKAVAYFTGTKGSISIYGDDIICPKDMSSLLIWVLSWLGFSVNTDKSCLDGPFRESCGGHYWNGLDVTPFYVLGPITTLPHLIDIANKLRKWGEVDGCGCLDPEIEEIWLWLKGFIPDVLWGGDDLSFKYQLVSSDIPRFRLVDTNRRRDAGPGGYFHWLNSTWDRTLLRDGVQTSRISKSHTGRLEMKRVRKSTVPQLPFVFLHEIRT